MMRETDLAEQGSVVGRIKDALYKSLGVAATGLALTACIPSGERGTLAGAEHTEVAVGTDDVVELSGIPVDELLPSSTEDLTSEILEKSEEEYTEYILGPERAIKLQDAINDQTRQLLLAVAENPNLHVFTRKDNGEEGATSFVRVEAIDSLGRNLIFNVFGHADETSTLRAPITISDGQSGAEEEETFGFVPYSASYSVLKYDPASNFVVVTEEAAISLYSGDRETFVTSVSDMQEDGLNGYIAWPFGIVGYTNDEETSLPKFDLGRAVLIDNMTAERVRRAFIAAKDMTSTGRLPASQ